MSKGFEYTYTVYICASWRFLISMGLQTLDVFAFRTITTSEATGEQPMWSTDDCNTFQGTGLRHFQ